MLIWVHVSVLCLRSSQQHRLTPLLEVEVGVSVAGDLLVALGMHDLLDLVVDEVVEGVDVLLHQAPHLCQSSRLHVNSDEIMRLATASFCLEFRASKALCTRSAVAATPG